MMIVPFIAGVKHNGKLFYSSVKSNGLFYFDPESKENQLISVFEKDPIRMFGHVRAFLNRDEMWLIPLESDHITCVNLNDMQMCYFAIPHRDLLDKRYAYYDGIRNGHEIYLIPYYMDTILKVDMDQHSVDILYEDSCLKPFWSRGGFVKNGVLSIIKPDGEIGLKIDTESGELLYKNEDSKDSSCCYFAQFDNEGWSFAYTTGVTNRYLIDDDGQLQHIDSIKTNDETYYRGIAIANDMILFPCIQNRRFLKYNKQNREITYYDGLMQKHENSDMWFEVNTIDADEGYWAATINGWIMDFSDLSNVKTCQSFAEEEMKKQQYAQYEKNGMWDRLFEESVQAEGYAQMDLNAYIQHIAITTRTK